jgi:hypothetical protein
LPNTVTKMIRNMIGRTTAKKIVLGLRQNVFQS